MKKLLLVLVLTQPAFAKDEGISKVKHVLVLMLENHSFDNYFGALAYAPQSPYHAGFGQCGGGDHACVDGLTCLRARTGELTCANANVHADGTIVHAFHDKNRCVGPDLDHSWVGTHAERNFLMPDDARQGKSDGFVRQNDETEQELGETMGFYTEAEIPFYYDLAQKFAIDDRYFSSTLGPTFPNRSFLLAGTSFGHLTTSDTFPPPGGYKPVTGTIFDLLEAHSVIWADYFQDAPQGGSFRPFGATGPIDPHFKPLTVLLAQLARAPGAAPLPQVSFIDPNFGILSRKLENDEHPPTDIQRGQAWVSRVVNAFRSSPYWNDSVLFITYDEHGGFYDHVPPPHAARPDDIAPGQCRDLSNPPASLMPGGGAECAANPLSARDTSVKDAIALCPELAKNPAGPYPPECAQFDELGVRVPFIAVSPFAKQRYVSHTAGDHTSMLAFIERAFLPASEPGDPSGERPHVTRRDLHADPLLDLFDFDNAPSKNVQIAPPMPPPAVDCTP